MGSADWGLLRNSQRHEMKGCDLPLPWDGEGGVARAEPRGQAAENIFRMFSEPRAQGLVFRPNDEKTPLLPN